MAGGDGEPAGEWMDHMPRTTGAEPVDQGRVNFPGGPYLLRLPIVPEPATLVLLAIGGLAVLRRRRGILRKRQGGFGHKSFAAKRVCWYLGS